jgi:hypothetical protein
LSGNDESAAEILAMTNDNCDDNDINQWIICRGDYLEIALPYVGDDKK